jgi:hypothetical protein
MLSNNLNCKDMLLAALLAKNSLAAAWQPAVCCTTGVLHELSQTQMLFRDINACLRRQKLSLSHCHVIPVTACGSMTHNNTPRWQMTNPVT